MLSFTCRPDRAGLAEAVGMHPVEGEPHVVDAIDLQHQVPEAAGNRQAAEGQGVMARIAAHEDEVAGEPSVVLVDT
jgi:hypothetical protein